MRVKPVIADTLWYYPLIVAFAVSPLYLWESGLPQVSHILAALAVGVHMLLRPKFFWIRGWIVGILFVLYTLAVGAVVYVQHMDPHTLLSPLYYVFDFAVFVLVVTVSSESGRPFLKLVFWIHFCVLAAVVAIIILGLGRTYSMTRAMGTFNDPNQLANWILCCVCIVASIGRSFYGSWLPGLLAVGLASIGILFSASRSGAVGLVTLIAVLLFAVYGDLGRMLKNGRARFRVSKILSLGVLSVLGLVEVVIATRLTGLGTATPVVLVLGQQADYLVSRFREIVQGRGYATFAGRGYDRLWVFPQYLILGAGEGATERFAARVWFLDEIHSSWAGLLFYYGLVGVTLFSLFVAFSLAKVRDRWHRLLLLGPFVYGFTTYNLRNWYIWVAFAIIVGSWVAIDSKSTKLESIR